MEMAGSRWKPLLLCLGVIALLVFGAATYNPFQTSPGDFEAAQTCKSRGQSDADILLVAGFSRTATSSMAQALQQLGYDTIHWKQWMNSHFDALYYKYDGLVWTLDVPRIIGNRSRAALLDCPMVSPVFEDCLAAYPNAKVIQTTRNTTDWLQSYLDYNDRQFLYRAWRAPALFALAHFSRAMRLSFVLQLLGIVDNRGTLDFERLPELSHLYRRSDEIVLGTWKPQLDVWPILKDGREYQIRAQVRPENLLVFDASNGDGWEKLEQFLGVQGKTRSHDAFPRHFSAKEVTTTSFQTEFVQHNRMHISIAAAVFFITMVVIGIAALCFSTDFSTRLSVFITLIKSYPRMRSIYYTRKKMGHFDYGGTASLWEDVGSHKAAQELSALRSSPGMSNVVFKDDFKVLKTYLPTDQAMGACMASVGLAVADLYELRGGRPQTVTVRRSDAGAVSVGGYLNVKVDPGEGYAGVDGFKHMLEAEGAVNPVRKPYLCKDGHHVFLHGGFPKLKSGILNFLGCKCDVGAIAYKTMEWNAAELESQMQASFLAASKCQTPAEWRASEQCRAIENLPVVLVEPRQGPPLARKLSTCAVTPLSDVIVIDFSHVIASPMVGRTLSEHGALVIKVVTEKRPRRPCFDEETNCGKVPAVIDVDTDEGKERLRAFLKVADILIDGYTSGALERLGFGIDEVEAINPSLIYVDVTCYGHLGPRKNWKGFQQNANFATGIAVVEDEELLAYQLVSQLDYATGLVGAYGAILALCERQQSGRASRVHTSLCRVASWMGLFGASCPSFLEFAGSAWQLLWGLRGHVERTGNSSYIRPPIQMSVTPPQRCVGFRRWWRDSNVNHFGESNVQAQSMQVETKQTTAVNGLNGFKDPSSKHLSIDHSGDSVTVQIRGRTDIVGVCSPHSPETIFSSTPICFPLIMKSDACQLGCSFVGEQSMSELTLHLVDEVAHCIENHLLENGAIIFRGLPLETPLDVSNLIDMIAPRLGWEPQTIAGGGTHRSLEAPNVQTSSNEPPSCAMEPHMDKAHQSDFPETIFFAMMVELPLGAGGETIVTNMRAVTSDLRERGIIECFEKKGGVLYEKTFWSAENSDVQMKGFTWQSAFCAEDKASVESKLSISGAKWNWLDDGILRVSNIEPVCKPHRLSGEALWFNGVHTNNSSYYLHAKHIETSRGVPMDTYFGNHEAIPAELMAEIRGCFWRHSVPLRLRTRDLLVVDNMIAAHGRMSWPDGLQRKLTLTHFKRISV